MGATMSNSPSSASSSGCSSFGGSSGSQGIGRGGAVPTHTKGIFTALLGGKRTFVVNSPSDDLTREDYGSPLSADSSSLGKWDVVGVDQQQHHNHHCHHFFAQHDTRRPHFESDAASRSRNHHSSSTRTTPSLKSATSTFGMVQESRRRRTLINSWNATKRAAVGLLPSALKSSRSREFSAYNAFTKQPSTTTTITNNNNGYLSHHFPMSGHDMGSREFGNIALCHLRSEGRTTHNKETPSLPPVTTTLASNRAKAISKVREIFESAEKSRRQREQEQEPGAASNNNNVIGGSAYCYSRSYTNRACEVTTTQSPLSHQRMQPQQGIVSVQWRKNGEELTTDLNRNEGGHAPRDGATTTTGGLSTRLRRDLKLTCKDFVNANDSSGLESSYDGCQTAKTPLSPIHTSHPLRIFKTASSQQQRDSSTSSHNSMQLLEWRGDSSKRSSVLADVKIGIQRPLSWGSARSTPFEKSHPNRSSHFYCDYNSDAIHHAEHSRRKQHRKTASIGERNAPRKTIQASTSELLRALSTFISIKSFSLLSDLRVQGSGEQEGQVESLDPAQVILWLRSVDRALILQGWQDIAFINPANLVFVYMLVRDRFSHYLRRGEMLKDVGELHSLVLTCLYISYSYMGNEISYPLRPFVGDTTDREHFWNRCIEMINSHSADMLRLNASSGYFFEVFSELKEFADC